MIKRTGTVVIALFLLAWSTRANGEIARKVVDIPTRPGVSQRMLVLSPRNPKAAVILFPGGHGGLQISSNGSIRWGKNNLLVRTRQLFAEKGLLVVLVDAPSDRQCPPYLRGFRQTPGHVADIKAVIAWVREQARVPVWLVGTSRGTQSAAYIAMELTGPEGPNGLVLSSTILKDAKTRPVPAMPLDRLRIPVLVIHHERDGCRLCPFSDIPYLMERLSKASRKQLLKFEGGLNRAGPCRALAYHGYNGLDREVVAQIVAWILAKESDVKGVLPTGGAE